MGHAAPPKNYEPKISDNLAAFAEIQGMSNLEVAAYQRHGIPII
ncbi:hypothetical protein [Oceanobacillus sp. CF4.6]